MSRKQSIWAGMLVSLLLVQSLLAANVEVMGVGSNRDAAIQDAKRTAVAQVIGEYVGSSSLVENYALVSDRILSSAGGFVSDVQVLEETPFGYEVRVRIRATVTAEALEADVNKIAVLTAQRGNPRFMVVPDPHPLADAYRPEDPVTGEARRGIIEYLSEKEMNVVQDTYWRGDVISGTPEMLRDLSQYAAGLGAEYAVYFTVRSHKGSGGRTFAQSSSNVTISVVHTGSYRIVAQADGEASGGAKNASEAARDAAHLAGRNTMDTIVKKLITHWDRKGSTSGNELTLILENIMDDELHVFEKVLEMSGGVKNVIRRSFASRKATLSIIIDGDLRDLAEAIDSSLKQKNYSWALIGSESSSLTYRAPDRVE